MEHVNRCTAVGTVTRRYFKEAEKDKQAFLAGDITVNGRKGAFIVPFLAFGDTAEDASGVLAERARVWIEGRLRYRSLDPDAERSPAVFDLVVDGGEETEDGKKVWVARCGTAKPDENDMTEVELVGKLASEPMNRSKTGKVFVTARLMTEQHEAGVAKPLVAYHDVCALSQDKAALLLELGRDQIVRVEGHLDVEEVGEKGRKAYSTRIIAEKTAVPDGVAKLPRGEAPAAAGTGGGRGRGRSRAA